MRQEGTVCVCSIGRQWQRTQNWSPEEFFSLEFSDSGSHSVQGFIDQVTYFYGYTGIIGHSSEKNPTGDQKVSMLTSSCCLQTHLLNEKDKNRELSSDLVLRRGQTGWSEHCSPRCAPGHPWLCDFRQAVFSSLLLLLVSAAQTSSRTSLALRPQRSKLSFRGSYWENSAGAVLLLLREGFASFFSDHFGFMHEFNRCM